MLRRDGRAVRREERGRRRRWLAWRPCWCSPRRPARRRRLRSYVPPQPTYAEDSGAIVRLEDLRVLRDAPDSPRDLTAIAEADGRPLAAPRRLRPRPCRRRGGSGRHSRRCSATRSPPCGRRPRSASVCSATRGRVPALLAALNGDASPMVRGRAAEALGLIGDASAAAPIGAYVTTLIGGGALASVQPRTSWAWPLAPEADACSARHLRAGAAQGGGTCSCRRSWTPRGAAAERVVADRLRAASRPRIRGRSAPMQVLLKGNGFYSAAFAAQGLGVSKQPRDRGAAAARRAGVGDAAGRRCGSEAVRGPRPPRRRSRGHAAGRAARRVDARSGDAGRSRHRARRA